MKKQLTTLLRSRMLNSKKTLTIVSCSNKEVQRKIRKSNKPFTSSLLSSPSVPRGRSRIPQQRKKDHSKQQSSTRKPISTKTAKPTLPPKELKKGKAKRICGCFGTKHKPLTNCLHCGRISCEVEGYDFCPHCHILIEDFSKRIHVGRYIKNGCSNSTARRLQERIYSMIRRTTSCPLTACGLHKRSKRVRETRKKNDVNCCMRGRKQTLAINC